MELLTILYALLAATIGFGGGDRAVALPGQAITAQASVAAVEVAQPCQQIVMPTRSRPAVEVALPAVMRIVHGLPRVAPQRLFAIAHFGRRRE